MSLPACVADVIQQHVTLTVECLDRLYLNVIQPRLQQENGIAWFFRQHRGELFATAKVMAAVTRPTTLNSLPRKNRMPSFLAKSTIGSSVAFTVVATTMASRYRLRLTRSTINSSIGRPTQGINTLPGNRVDVILASIEATTNREFIAMKINRIQLTGRTRSCLTSSSTKVKISATGVPRRSAMSNKECLPSQ